MKGQVYLINHNIEWVAILTENLQFSIIEIIGMPMPNIGDMVSGEFESFGSTTINNRTQNDNFDGFIQEIYADLQHARTMLKWDEERKHCESI